MIEAYKPTEAAKKIGVTRSMVYKLEKRGLLTRLEGHSKHLFTSESVEGLKAVKGANGRIQVVSAHIWLKQA